MDIDPDLIVVPRLLQSWIDDAASDLWDVVALVVILGIVAVVLAMTGIYSVVSFAVSQMTRDLGIRVALGAQRLDIIREVVHQGLVDLMLMSAYVNEQLTIKEGLFRYSHVTPAARANERWLESRLPLYFLP